jgi:hypothetical protein
MMQVRISVSAVLLMFMLAVSPLHAQYVEMHRVNEIAMDLPEQEVLGKLATHLGVSVDVLKEQKAEYKVNFGELYIAHRLAKFSGSDFKTVVGAFRSGTAWGVYAKEKKIDMAELSKDERQLENVLKKKT